MISTCKYWHVFLLKTCQYFHYVFACILVRMLEGGCWLSLAVGAVLARAPDLTLAVPTPVLADNWLVLVQVMKTMLCVFV